MLNPLSQLRKRALKKTMGSLASDEAVEALVAGQLGKQPLTEGLVDFLLVFVRGADAALLSKRVGKVADLAIKQGALVHDLAGPLVTIAFGTSPGKAPEPSGNRAALLQELHRHLADDIKVLHGSVQATFGLIGGESRQSYALLLPKFDLMLGYLSQMNFGQVEEFQP